MNDLFGELLAIIELEDYDDRCNTLYKLRDNYKGLREEGKMTNLKEGEQKNE